MQLQKCYKNLRTRGSITVEACIALPVFLSMFFLLLFMVKFACTGMLLDHAVNEAAKEIAASAYPICFINELEDEKIGEYREAGVQTTEEEIENLAGKLEAESPGNLLKAIISEDFKEIDVSALMKGLLVNYTKGMVDGIIDGVTPAYWEMKAAVKYSIADELVREHLDSTLINQSDVRLTVVEFPQGKEEYSEALRNKSYKPFGLIPDRDFSSDDVVLQLEYDYKINLPFTEAVDIKMVHTAVERAWINGSFGILTDKEEGLDLEPEGQVVFITRTGIRYHKGSCRYLRKSKIPVDMEQAEEDGYTPCKVCKPLSYNQS